jgi:uncharacterized protein
MPLEANTKKHLIKSPKIYFRDSGLLHRLLMISDFNSLLSNPVFGSSWEGLVIENMIAAMPDWTPSFYRTATGNEIDLVLSKGDRRIAVECKASTAPALTKGWWDAIHDIEPEHVLVVAPIENTSYEIRNGVIVTGLEEGLALVKKI